MLQQNKATKIQSTTLCGTTTICTEYGQEAAEPITRKPGARISFQIADHYFEKEWMKNAGQPFLMNNDTTKVEVLRRIPVNNPIENIDKYSQK